MIGHKQNRSLGAWNLGQAHPPLILGIRTEKDGTMRGAQPLHSRIQFFLNNLGAGPCPIDNGIVIFRLHAQWIQMRIQNGFGQIDGIIENKMSTIGDD